MGILGYRQFGDAEEALLMVRRGCAELSILEIVAALQPTKRMNEFRTNRWASAQSSDPS